MREPIDGSRKKVVPSVPAMLPMVEMPYTAPDTVPERAAERSISRIANGEYMPKNVTGKNRIAIEASRLPALMSSIPASTHSSIGCAKPGSTSM